MRTPGDRIAAAPGRPPEAPADPDPAIRCTLRSEIDPANLAVASRLLAAMPRRTDDVGDVIRVAAAGRDLVELCGYVERMRGMVRDGELPMATGREQRLLAKLAAAAGDLVRLVEAHLGAFPAGDSPWRQQGLRETYLVDIAPEHRDDARAIVDLAHQASQAPEPLEPVARMMLRRVGDDLREVARYLDRLSAWIGEEGLRELAAAVASGCGELATAIAGTLPPEPVERAPIGGAGWRRRGGLPRSSSAVAAGRPVQREAAGR